MTIWFQQIEALDYQFYFNSISFSFLQCLSLVNALMLDSRKNPWSDPQFLMHLWQTPSHATSLSGWKRCRTWILPVDSICHRQGFHLKAAGRKEERKEMMLKIIWLHTVSAAFTVGCRFQSLLHREVKFLSEKQIGLCLFEPWWALH